MEDDVFKKFERHLLCLEDIELILLKGHLLIEQEVNGLLEYYIKDEKEFKKLNLVFSKRLTLLRALDNFGCMSQYLDHVAELNRIRNKLTHKLDFTEWHKDLKKWACTVQDYTPKTINRKRTYRNTLIRAIVIVCGMLHGVSIGRDLHDELKGGV